MKLLIERVLLDTILALDDSSQIPLSPPDIVQLSIVPLMTLSRNIPALSGLASDVTETFQFEGGALVLEDPTDIAYEPDYTVRLIEEDIIVEKASEYLSVGTYPDGLAILSETGTSEIVTEITKDLSDIPQDERHTVNIAVDAPGSLNLIDEEGETVSIGRSDVRTGPEFSDPDLVDEIFLRDIITDLGTDEYVIRIEDLSDVVSDIRYITEADDYILFLKTYDPVITLRYTKIKGIATGVSTSVLDTESAGSTTDVPYPADALRGPRLIQFDTVVEPGVYTLFYNARIRDGYDAGLEEGGI